MAAPTYQVETISGDLAVLSDNTPGLNFFKSLGVAGNLELSTYSPDNLRTQPFPQPEAWVIFLTPSLGSYFLNEGRGVWHNLTTHPHPHLYVLTKAWQEVPLALPTHSTELILGEYLGFDQDGSPSLTVLKQALASHNLNLSNKAISSLHLMSEAYLQDALIAILKKLPVAPRINLGNPDGVALSTLAQALSDQTQTPLNLSYSETGYDIHPPESFFRSSHSCLSHLTPPDTLKLALAHLKTISTSSPPPPPQKPLKELPRATPRVLKSAHPHGPISPSRPANLSRLEFVPLRQDRRLSGFSFPTFQLNHTFKLALRGVLLGLIIYLGSLALALGITLVTIHTYRNNLAAHNLTQLRPPAAALTSANYLYTNAVAFGYQEGSLLLEAYLQGLKLTQTLDALTNNLTDFSAHVLGDRDLDLASNITSLRVNIEKLYQLASLLDAALPNTTPRLLKKYDSDYQSLKQLFPNFKKNILYAKGITSILPDIIALEDRAKYLVLFQNNNELRATGGFIGSYGLLSFEKGKLYDFQVYDVYSADGALKGHVEPPPPIKDILGEAKWYLRDSNFDPDFPTTARRAEWFLSKSMNQEVEGTIALNLYTLKQLLSALGDLTLPDYNETITQFNLFERAQFHAEVNFFPGSTAKKEFLSSVADVLFHQLKNSEPQVLFKATLALVQSLDSSDIQLSLKEPSTEKVLQTLGWTGELEHKPCPSTPCYEDYLLSVDSNFGVNKANHYITKTQNLDVTFDKEGRATNKLLTTWTNSAPNSAWPAGTYKNYVRFYLPLSSTIVALSLNNNPLNNSEYTVATEHNRLVIATLTNTPIDSSTTLTLTYSPGTTLKTDQLYSLYLQKQSGSKPSDQTHVTINCPLYLKPLRLSPAPTNTASQRLIYSFANDADHRLTIQF